MKDVEDLNKSVNKIRDKIKTLQESKNDVVKSFDGNMADFYCGIKEIESKISVLEKELEGTLINLNLK